MNYRKIHDSISIPKLRRIWHDAGRFLIKSFSSLPQRNMLFSFTFFWNINDFRSIPAQCRARQEVGRFLTQSSSFHLKKKYLLHFNNFVEDKRLPFDPRAMQNKISSITRTLWDHHGIALGLLRNIFGVAVGGMIS